MKLEERDGHIVEVAEPHDRPGRLSIIAEGRCYLHDERMASFVQICGDRDGLVALRDGINQALEGRDVEPVDTEQMWIKADVGLRQSSGGFPLTVKIIMCKEKKP